MFNIVFSKGFHMTFSNGWTVSVQFGFGNYCDNQYDRTAGTLFPGNAPEEVKSKTAEVAAWHESGEKIRFQNNDWVKGWMTADEVGEFIAMVQALPAPVMADA